MLNAERVEIEGQATATKAGSFRRLVLATEAKIKALVVRLRRSLDAAERADEAACIDEADAARVLFDQAVRGLSEVLEVGT